jgi:IS30 family transposase
VFSLPSAASVLALRRERFELARLVRRIAARQVASAALGLSRQTVSQRVKRGDLRAVHIHPRRTKERPAYRATSPQDGLF